MGEGLESQVRREIRAMGSLVAELPG